MPSAKSSGKKLSKAEKEKKKREEEERRRQQEEEDRVRQEQEDRERRKREKTEAEERRRREKEEQKVRVVELAELRTMLGSFSASRQSQLREARSRRRWDRYLRCDGSPDPTVLPQVNTFILVWRADTKRVLIDDVLHDSTLCLDLIKELEDVIEDDKEELEAETVRQYRATIADLQAALREKLGRATYETLRRGVTMADGETANLQQVWRSSAISLCLWGNLSKNPRIRSFEFAEPGVSFDIPKALTKVGCAYQFLLTDFDHFSPQSPSFHAVPVPKEEEQQQQEEEVAAEAPAEEEDAAAEEAAAEEPEAPAREPTLDLMAELQRADGEEAEAEAEAEAEEEEELETPEEDLRRSPPPQEFEDFDGEEDAMDLRAYHTVGPIVNFSVLQIPPQPLERRGWTIVQHQEPPQPISFDYRPEPIVRKEAEEAEEAENNTTTDAASTAATSQQQGAKKLPEIDNPPLTVVLKLPTNVFFAEEPKVAKWDAERREWRTDGVEVTKFDEEARALHFRTSVFGALALLQDFHINMPFQSWELRPLGSRSCQLTVVASINEVVLHVKDCEVCVAPSAQTERQEGEESLGRKELSHLEGQWTSVRELVRSLRAAGVNIFPREDSHKHVDVPDKSRVAEAMLYEQMALLSPAFAFAWSRWNTDCQDRDSFVLQACEHLNDAHVNEDDLALFAFTRRHVRRLKMREFDEEFSPEVDEAVAFHADFYHLLQEVAGEEARARVAEVDFLYLATVRELLQATRLLVFS